MSEPVAITPSLTVTFRTCRDCGKPSTGFLCRKHQDQANARHARWREARRAHFKDAQKRQRKRRRRLRALEREGKATLKVEVVSGRRLLVAVANPSKRKAHAR